VTSAANKDDGLRRCVVWSESAQENGVGLFFRIAFGCAWGVLAVVCLAVAGTGLALDKGIGLLMVVLIFASYWHKIRVEERLMMETFPEEYPKYRRRAKALIPGIL
jgi:protein-S-isoprenylcysteine O-methyltransferase Ste14